MTVPGWLLCRESSSGVNCVWVAGTPLLSATWDNGPNQWQPVVTAFDSGFDTAIDAPSAPYHSLYLASRQKWIIAASAKETPFPANSRAPYTIINSSDTHTWNAFRNPIDFIVNGLATAEIDISLSNDRVVIAGIDNNARHGTGTAVLAAYSDDAGATWTPSLTWPGNQTRGAIALAYGGFAVIGYGLVASIIVDGGWNYVFFTSIDGITWIQKGTITADTGTGGPALTPVNRFSMNILRPLDAEFSVWDSAVGQTAGLGNWGILAAGAGATFTPIVQPDQSGIARFIPDNGDTDDLIEISHNHYFVGNGNIIGGKLTITADFSMPAGTQAQVSLVVGSIGHFQTLPLVAGTPVQFSFDPTIALGGRGALQTYLRVEIFNTNIAFNDGNMFDISHAVISDARTQGWVWGANAFFVAGNDTTGTYWTRHSNSQGFISTPLSIFGFGTLFVAGGTPLFSSLNTDLIYSADLSDPNGWKPASTQTHGPSNFVTFNDFDDSRWVVLGAVTTNHFGIFAAGPFDVIRNSWIMAGGDAPHIASTISSIAAGPVILFVSPPTRWGTNHMPIGLMAAQGLG